MCFTLSVFFGVFPYFTRSFYIFSIFLCHFLNKKTHRKGKDFLYALILTKNPVENSKKSCDKCVLKHFFLLHRNMIFRRKIHTRMIFYTWYNKTIQHTHSVPIPLYDFLLCSHSHELNFFNFIYREIIIIFNALNYLLGFHMCVLCMQ